MDYRNFIPAVQTRYSQPNFGLELHLPVSQEKLIEWASKSSRVAVGVVFSCLVAPRAYKWGFLLGFAGGAWEHVKPGVAPQLGFDVGTKVIAFVSKLPYPQNAMVVAGGALVGGVVKLIVRDFAWNGLVGLVGAAQGYQDGTEVGAQAAQFLGPYFVRSAPVPVEEAETPKGDEVSASMEPPKAAVREIKNGVLQATLDNETWVFYGNWEKREAEGAEANLAEFSDCGVTWHPVQALREISQSGEDASGWHWVQTGDLTAYYFADKKGWFQRI